MVGLYTQLLASRREELSTERGRLVAGLRKLRETNALVADMGRELAALQPVLASKAAATAELLKRVDGDQAEAERVRAVVEVEEADVKRMQQATQVGGPPVAAHC
jgi:dynein heavy chain, axonemal